MIAVMVRSKRMTPIKKLRCPRCDKPLSGSTVKSMWGSATSQRSKYEDKDEAQVAVTLPCCSAILDYDGAKSLWAGWCSRQRTVRAGGPGRPKSKDRCPCGLMTRARAEKRNHVCEAPAKRNRKKKR